MGAIPKGVVIAIEKGDGERLAKERPNWPIQTLARIDIVEGRGDSRIVGNRMDMNRHEFQLDDLIERIKANDNRLVALQVPEGLKMQALEMMDSIEEDTSARIILAAIRVTGSQTLYMTRCRGWV